MINLSKNFSDVEMINKLNDFLCNNDFNSFIGNYEDNNFLVLESWEEKERIENFMSNYMDLNDFYYSSLDSLFSSNYGFGDEYTTCYGCNNIVCLTPGYYGDQPKYHVFEESCELLCKNCISIDNLIEDVKNDPSKCIKSSLFTKEDLKNEGFVLLNENFQSGLHKGMNDDPKKIFDLFKNQHNEIVFFLNETSQFYVSFSAYGRNIE